MGERREAMDPTDFGGVKTSPGDTTTKDDLRVIINGGLEFVMTGKAARGPKWISMVLSKM